VTIRSNAFGSRFAETERRANESFDQNLDDVEQIVDDVMQEAADIAQDVILRNGVRDTIPNNEGRIESETMFDAVKSRTRRTSRDRIVGQAGWIPGEKIEPYFGFQESGTLGRGEGASPRGIRPMMAIAEANIYARDKLRERLGR